MMEALATVLVSNGIRTPADRYWADVEGDIENVNEVLKITTIQVEYHLKVIDNMFAYAKIASRHKYKNNPLPRGVIEYIKLDDKLILEK